MQKKRKKKYRNLVNEERENKKKRKRTEVRHRSTEKKKRERTKNGFRRRRENCAFISFFPTTSWADKNDNQKKKQLFLAGDLLFMRTCVFATVCPRNKEKKRELSVFFFQYTKKSETFLSFFFCDGGTQKKGVFSFVNRKKGSNKNKLFGSSCRRRPPLFLSCSVCVKACQLHLFRFQNRHALNVEDKLGQCARWFKDPQQPRLKVSVKRKHANNYKKAKKKRKEKKKKKEHKCFIGSFAECKKYAEGMTTTFLCVSLSALNRLWAFSHNPSLKSHVCSELLRTLFLFFSFLFFCFALKRG